MKKNLLKKPSRQAFTLIELSFVIIVISVIIAGLVSIMASKSANEKARVVNANFDVIYQALGKYLVTNKKLPCPASLIESKTSSATYATAIAAYECVGAGVYLSNTSINLVYGMVPTKTLGLSSEFSEDAYGSKIVYVVDRRLTTTTLGGFEDTVGTSPLITISGDAAVNNALFVLISRGANKSGSYSANSAAIPKASTNSDELSNDASGIVENIAPTPSSSNFYNTFIQSATSGGFDDSIFYKTQDQLLNDFNAWSLIPCTSGTSTQTLYGTSITWPKAYQDQIVVANTACPSPNWNGSVGAPSKKCGAKGVWGSIAKPCTCSAGYTGPDCNPDNCEFSGVTGIQDGTTVSSGSSSLTCDDGYSGTIYYTCTAGVVTVDSGSCG